MPNDSGDDGPEHLPGLEPDDPEHLPGLEPEEAEPETEPEPESEASPDSGTPDVPRYGPDGLSLDELNEWFANDYVAGQEASRAGRVYEGAPRTVQDWFRLSLLSPIAKSRFRDEILWQRHRSTTPDDREPGDPSDGGWDSPPLEQVYVTLPDGSEVAVEFDREAAAQRVVDGDGNAGEWQPIEVVPDDLMPPPTEDAPAPEPTSQVGAGFGGFKTIVIGGVATAAAGVIAFLALSGGGGGASGPWSVTDPQNDFVPAFADKDAITTPNSAGDVTRLDVAIANGNTTVTVNFAGPAEELMTEGGQELAAALQFIPIGDERWIDILFNEDGSVKISDPPSGSRITATWTAANVLVFEILGVTPASGATVRFATIQRSGFAHSTDEVSLAAGDADSVVATAFVTDDSGGSGGVPDAPVIVSPCSVLDVETVSGAFGPAVRTDGGGDGRRVARCTYEIASEGITLQLLVQRNSAPRNGIFRSFRSVNEDDPETTVEIRSIDWSDEGEVRVNEFGTSRSKAALLAYVHTSDPVGREIYVWITATGPPGDGIALGAVIETFAEILRDAVLEAQP